MMKIFRNTVMAAVLVALLGANIFWQLLNPYVACIGALVVAYAAGWAVERAFIKRASDEMWRLYGKDWA